MIIDIMYVSYVESVPIALTLCGPIHRPMDVIAYAIYYNVLKFKHCVNELRH